MNTQLASRNGTILKATLVSFSILFSLANISCSGKTTVEMPSLTMTPTPTPTPSTGGGVACPTNYVLIAANASFGTSAFCLAKYEMKATLNDGTPVFDGYNGGVALDRTAHKPESRPDGIPWVNILYADAVAECASLGTGYHLATLKEWQVAAREIESVGMNWSGGATGSGTLYKGNAIDIDPTTARANGDAVAGTSLLSARTGVDPYLGTGKTSSDTWGSGKEAKRTFTLASGDVIWDMSGNGRDMVDIDGLGGTLSYTGAGSSTYFEPGAAGFGTAISSASTTNAVSLTSDLFSLRILHGLALRITLGECMCVPTRAQERLSLVAATGPAATPQACMPETGTKTPRLQTPLQSCAVWPRLCSVG